VFFPDKITGEAMSIGDVKVFLFLSLFLSFSLLTNDYDAAILLEIT
jgi:hypothetical protein